MGIQSEQRSHQEVAGGVVVDHHAFCVLSAVVLHGIPCLHRDLTAFVDLSRSS
jgi:hypothetical protein